MNKGALALTIVGVALMVLSGLALAGTVLLIVASDGKIDVDEAAPALGGGGCCCFTSVILLAAGGIWLLVSQKPTK